MDDDKSDGFSSMLEKVNNPGLPGRQIIVQRRPLSCFLVCTVWTGCGPSHSSWQQSSNAIHTNSREVVRRIFSTKCAQGGCQVVSAAVLGATCSRVHGTPLFFGRAHQSFSILFLLITRYLIRTQRIIEHDRGIEERIVGAPEA